MNITLFDGIFLLCLVLLFFLPKQSLKHKWYWVVPWLIFFVTLGIRFYSMDQNHKKSEKIKRLEFEVTDLKKKTTPTNIVPVSYEVTNWKLRNWVTLGSSPVKEINAQFTVHVKFEKENFNETFRFLPMTFELRIPEEAKERITFVSAGGQMQPYRNKDDKYWKIEVSKPSLELEFDVSGPTLVHIYGSHLYDYLKVITLDIRMEGKAGFERK